MSSSQLVHVILSSVVTLISQFWLNLFYKCADVHMCCSSQKFILAFKFNLTPNLSHAYSLRDILECKEPLIAEKIH